MSNPYYAATLLTRHTQARADAQNSERIAVEAGFDRLPPPDALAQNRVTYVTLAGPANVYAAALTPALVAYADGLALKAKVNVANTGPATINLNGLGARAVKRPDGSDPSAGALPAGGIVELVYDGVAFVLTSSVLIDVTAAAGWAASAAASAAAAAAYVATLDTWGSNANGFWVRHASGVQECWHVIDQSTVDWGTASGSAGYMRSAPLVWTFPQPFANATVVVTPTPERDASVIMGAGILPSSLTQARIMPWAAVSLLAGATKAVRLHAIGRHYV